MHVEAGLRTGGLNLTPFPEELNRQVISSHRLPALRADRGRTCENLVRENVPVEPDLRHRQHRHRRAALGVRARRPLREPGAPGALRRRPPDRRRHRPPARELGRRPARRSPRASRRLAARRTPRSASSSRCTRTRACARCWHAPAARPRQRAAHRAARLRDLRAPARPLPPRHHRLRRHPGGGALARQAGAGHPRDDRAHRGRRGRGTLRAGRHRPGADLRRGGRLLDDPIAYAQMARRRTPTATARRPSGSSPRSSTSCSAASRRPVRPRLQPRRGRPRGRLRAAGSSELEAASLGAERDTHEPRRSAVED